MEEFPDGQHTEEIIWETLPPGRNTVECSHRYGILAGSLLWAIDYQWLPSLAEAYHDLKTYSLGLADLESTHLAYSYHM